MASGIFFFEGSDDPSLPLNATEPLPPPPPSGGGDPFIITIISPPSSPPVAPPPPTEVVDKMYTLQVEWGTAALMALGVTVFFLRELLRLYGVRTRLSSRQRTVLTALVMQEAHDEQHATIEVAPLVLPTDRLHDTDKHPPRTEYLPPLPLGLLDRMRLKPLQQSFRFSDNSARRSFSAGSFAHRPLRSSLRASFRASFRSSFHSSSVPAFVSGRSSNNPSDTNRSRDASSAADGDASVVVRNAKPKEGPRVKLVDSAIHDRL